MLTTSVVRNKLLSIDVTDPPTTPIMTTAEGKKYANVTFGTEDDVLIDGLIESVTDTIERSTRRSLLTQEVTIVWQATTLPLRLFRSPIQSVVSVKTRYEGTLSTAETLTNFYVAAANGLRPKLFFKEGFEFTESSIEEIEIVVSCGFGDDASAVPAKLIQAARLILNQFYDRRDDLVAGDRSGNLVPFHARSLMSEFESPVI